LDEIDDIQFGEDACDGIKMNRFNKEYDAILAICEMFLNSTSLSMLL